MPNYSFNQRKLRGTFNFFLRAARNSWHPLPDPRAVFIHIPKTAGTSVNSWLSSGMERLNLRSRNIKSHYSHPQGAYFLYLGHLNPDFPVESGVFSSKQLEKSFSFAFVRNPFDRLISLHSHLRRHDQLQATLTEFLNSLVNPRLFDSAETRRRAVHMGRPMSRWLEPVTWRGPRAVFRVEEIDRAEKILQSELGIYEPLPKIGRSAHKIRVKLTAGDIELIQQIYSEDFERFGYSLDPSESRLLGRNGR